MKTKSILIIAPHPDDETLGCGGIIAKNIQQGASIHVVLVTDGSNLFKLSPWKIEADPTPVQASAMRKAETQKSLQILGGGKVSLEFIDIEDATLADNLDLAVEKLSEIITRINPDKIYVTSEHEYHSDHRAACKAARLAIEAAQSAAKLFRYTILLPDGKKIDDIDQPKLAVDITAQLEKKRQAASQFQSHLRIISPKQTEAFFESVEPWLNDHEIFLTDF